MCLESYEIYCRHPMEYPTKQVLLWSGKPSVVTMPPCGRVHRKQLKSNRSHSLGHSSSRARHQHAFHLARDHHLDLRLLGA
jgi:hypothetical protein